MKPRTRLRLSHDHDHDGDHQDDASAADHGHDLGLSHDLPKILGRRKLLAGLGAVGATAALAACGSTTDDADASSGDRPTPPDGGGGGTDQNAASTTADGEIPEETAGPYPADGSNGPDILSESGVVRKDITTSFGDYSGTAEGVPLSIRLKVLNLDGDDVSAYAGAAVYLWHCNRDGAYSLYTVADQNYLRGVQEVAKDGSVEFTSIFPAAYSGRWPHIHFEGYPSLEDAQSASNRLRTSQIALPEDVCQDVYDNADGYDASVANLAATSLDSDNVFSDGHSLQLAKVTGSVDKGYVARLTVPV